MIFTQECGQHVGKEFEDRSVVSAECLCCTLESNTGWRCRKNFRHAICSTCFPHLVRSASENYLNGEIPLRCPDPSCRKEIETSMIRRLLCDDMNGGGVLVWDSYQQACLRTGLIQKAEEVTDLYRFLPFLLPFCLSVCPSICFIPIFLVFSFFLSRYMSLCFVPGPLDWECGKRHQSTIRTTDCTHNPHRGILTCVQTHLPSSMFLVFSSHRSQ